MLVLTILLLLKINNNQVVVTHREYIQDITQSTGFTNVVPTNGLVNTPGFIINPANPGTFPWLSQIAINFQQYQFLGCVFEYRSLCGEISTALPLGSVSLATNYNTNDSTFATRIQALNTEFHVDGKPTEDLIHPIETKPSQTSIPIMYTNGGTIPTNSDARLYNLGLMQIMTNGNPSGSGVVGELYVSYKVALYKPILLNQVADGGASAHYFLPAAAAGAPMANATLVNPVTSSVALDTIGLTFNGATGTTVTIESGNEGNYLFQWNWFGASTASLSAPAINLTTNVNAFNLYNADTTSFAGPSSSTNTSTCLSITRMFTIPASGAAVITLGVGGTLPGTPTTGDLWVIRLPSGIQF